MTYDAKQRLKILTFQENHGMAAACDAFKVSRRTLYRWRQTLREAGHLEPWCERHGLATPSVSTIGRIIAAALDKMRRIPQRLDARGRRRPYRRINRLRRPRRAEFRQQ